MGILAFVSLEKFSSLGIVHLSRRNTKRQEYGWHSRGLPQYKLVGYHDLEAVRPNASGSLCSEYGTYNKLSRNTMCSTYIHIIFSPFINNSGCHFKRMARFKTQWKYNTLALYAIATILSTQSRGSHRSHVPDRIFPERMLPLTTLRAISLDIFHVLASGKQRLYARKIRNVYAGFIRVLGILSHFEIVEYIFYR